MTLRPRTAHARIGGAYPKSLLSGPLGLIACLWIGSPYGQAAFLVRGWGKKKEERHVGSTTPPGQMFGNILNQLASRSVASKKVMIVIAREWYVVRTLLFILVSYIWDAQCFPNPPSSLYHQKGCWHSFQSPLGQSSIPLFPSSFAILFTRNNLITDTSLSLSFFLLSYPFCCCCPECSKQYSTTSNASLLISRCCDAYH
ncbi:hypothetical protein QR685DRAFT_344481 [Neurospora intermedia]|uniref:Uncharacterized protein n=1 Tax=Neurospora intermedia TaxID=5142 RepID=A0ABR3D7B4_NEUIN